MDRLCLGTFGNALKAVINEPRTNVRTVELALDLVLSNVTITNQKGENYQVTDTNASEMLACKIPVHRGIMRAASSSAVIAAAKEYAEDAIIAEMPDYELEGFVQTVASLISNDTTIPKAKRDGFLANASVASAASFIADVLLYILKKQNKFDEPATAAPTNTQYESLLKDVAEASERLKGTPKPIALTTPPNVDEEKELRYVSALLDAYADAEKQSDLPIERLADYPKYKANFDRQRKDFYAAETIRRSARDAFGKDNDAFDSLRSETYDGIIDVHSLDYDNGFERLNRVLAHTTTLSFPNCIIQKADWLGKSEQKGVCHILVNDGDLDGWVNADE